MHVVFEYNKHKTVDNIDYICSPNSKKKFLFDILFSK